MEDIDQILLRGMSFYGYHGVNPEERSQGQKFVVDVVIDCSLTKAAESDRVEDTVNYSEVFRIVKSIVEGKPYNLLETVAKNISDKILLNYDIHSVSVTIKKPEVRIHESNLDYAGITVTRYGNK
ncbi:MAG: dihydroneopterin aldolase [Chloroflexota bacterium]|mgnify:CR=1 FL=1|nr:dihydroneopterin aldolase [Chloroflexota bacterium]MEC9366359.1 dihydroneopterin aldolase [Chloroflexota bacterium]MED6296299.1 dihydroneopterin aldolase [Chloroflexota bacterium]|tara:strand:- start:2187 stop:2561 length:375 start_codon:yes stop_codon:yes gene_type:complete